MKHAICIMVIFSIMPVTCKPKSRQFDIILESRWEDLEQNQKRKYFDDKWILAGNITFKKKAPDIVSLKELDLTWKGEKLNNLIGSLYEKTIDGIFIPIEKFHICDSVWKGSEQKLILKFNKPKKLSAVNTLCLVLTIPKNLENKLRHGCFHIEKESLPEPYREYVTENDILLEIGKATPEKQPCK